MSSSPATILIVDDDDTLRQSLAAWLEDEGFTPLQAANGQQGLELADTHSPDLILLDLRMPGMDGLTVLEQLRRKGHTMPVVVISGQGDIDDACQAFRQGAWDYIAKPIQSLDLLTHTVEQALERRRLQVKVRRAEERYSNLVENVPLVIFCLDRNLDLEFVNQGCWAVLGFTQAQALADPGWLLERIHPGDRARMRLVFEQSIGDCSVSFSKACRLVHKSGATVHGVIKSIPFPGCALAEPRQSLEGVIVDITDRLLLEKHQVQTEKLKTLGAISAEVAHEIRNPLSAIGGFARRLARKYPDLAEASVILEESTRLERLLDRIRDYLSPVSLSRQAVPLADVVAECLATVAAELEANGVSYALDVQAAETLVQQDPQVLAQVVMGLIRAVLAAMPPKGLMGLTIAQGGEFLLVEVKGDQLTPVEDPETLFLPFGEGGDTMGLPFCSRLLRAMGGLLWFDQKDGRGRFVMTVPVAGSRKEAPAG